MPERPAPLDAPGRSLLADLAADAAAGVEPWFLPEAWGQWEATGDATGLRALGLDPSRDRPPWAPEP
jgi:hypothetical protein